MGFGDSKRFPTSDERELLLLFLHRERENVVRTADGLTEEQLRWTPEGKLLPILGIINHLTHVEWRWIEGRYLEAPFPARTNEFAVPDDVPSKHVVSAYWDRSQRTAEAVRAATSLAIPCVGREGTGPPVHELMGYAGPIDLRWVVLHLIEETAHHAGHADSTREMLDGKRMSG